MLEDDLKKLSAIQQSNVVGKLSEQDKMDVALYYYKYKYKFVVIQTFLEKERNITIDLSSLSRGAKRWKKKYYPELSLDGVTDSNRPTKIENSVLLTHASDTPKKEVLGGEKKATTIEDMQNKITILQSKEDNDEIEWDEKKSLVKLKKELKELV